jgi:hypothetical protein
LDTGSEKTHVAADLVIEVEENTEKSPLKNVLLGCRSITWLVPIIVAHFNGHKRDSTI